MPRNNNTTSRHQVRKPRDRSRTGRGRERHLSVRGELRREPDVRKIARAVIAMAMAQAEADAANQTARQSPPTPLHGDGDGDRDEAGQ